METKHTKGEWLVEQIHEDENIIHITLGGGYIDEIATLYGGGKQLIELRSNAKLIAAAPELLEALIDLTSSYRNYINNGQEHLIKNALNAIKKATE